MKIDWKIILGIVVAVAVLATVLVWFFFLRSTPTVTTNTSPTFNSAGSVSATVGNTAPDTTNAQTNVTSTVSQQKIFQVATGPIAGVTLIQTLHPTTTVARYVMADNGHVFDLVLDSPGTIARAVSNTTIPGVINAVWLGKGSGVILQYLDTGVVKTVSLSFPTSTTTNNGLGQAVQMQFLPDNILSVAASPDGTSVAYLLQGSNGADGYVAKANGTASKKLFSLPLSEILLSWPSQNTLLAQTKSATGIQGMAFSVNAATGATVALFSAPGLTAIADSTFTHIIYQTTSGSTRTSYVHDLQKGEDSGLSFDPFPEKCILSNAAANAFYCAAPLQYVAANYLDLWHQGLASAADSIFLFTTNGKSALLTTPGGSDGGVSSDIESLSVSPDDHYLLFIKRGDDSLWGVRLTQ